MEIEPISEIKIAQVQNWFLISIKKDDEESLETNIIIEEKPTEWEIFSEYQTDYKSEQEALKELLERIKEYFWCNYSKHHSQNLFIKIEKNDKM